MTDQPDTRRHRQRRLSEEQPRKETDVDDVMGGTIWTCPMHPQIRRSEPGNCPICGMALEPLEPSLEEGPNPELIDMTRRFGVSAVLSAILVALVMATEGAGWEPLPMGQMIWLQFALTTPVVLWGGWPLFERSGPR